MQPIGFIAASIELATCASGDARGASRRRERLGANRSEIFLHPARQLVLLAVELRNFRFGSRELVLERCELGRGHACEL